MKKVIGLALFLIAVVLACSKNDGTTSFRDPLPTHSLKSMTAHGIQWRITCEGSCDQCGLLKVNDWSYQCQCTEKCELLFMRIGLSPESDQQIALVDSLLSRYGTFKHQLQTSLEQRYGSSAYQVKAVDAYHQGTWFGLRYTLLLAEGQEISLSYYKTDADAPGYEVDCTGSCVSASARCWEEVTMGDPPKINCSCEGDCHLTITPVEEPNK